MREWSYIAQSGLDNRLISQKSLLGRREGLKRLIIGFVGRKTKNAAMEGSPWDHIGVRRAPKGVSIKNLLDCNCSTQLARERHIIRKSEK